MNDLIRGIELYYDLVGNGDPLLCIHGFPLSGEMWTPLGKALGDRYRLIVPDLRGHGRSGVSENVTMADFADDLAALLNTIGITQPVVVIGLSMGGYIAFEFHRRHRDRVRAMVLSDTRAEADTPQRSRDRRETARNVLRDGSRVVADAMIDKLFAPQSPPALRDPWHRIMSASDPRGVAASLGAMADRPDSFDTLKSISVPTLIVVGKRDAITPVDVARLMHEATPGSRLEIIPGAGHMVPVEAPQAFAAVLDAFLSSLPPSFDPQDRRNEMRKPMKVLIADKLNPSCVEELNAAGCEVALDATLEGRSLKEAIVTSQCRVLVVRSTRVTAEILEASDQLSLVVRAGAGVNNIDLRSASRRSVLVANCPGKNAVAVAELTFGLILALDRRIVENTTDLKNGLWNKQLYSRARGLKGRTLGILGLGTIGEVVAERAHAFGMEVIAWSRSLTPERAEERGVICADSPKTTATNCDILSIHLSATPETKNLVNRDVLRALRPGAFLINTARAEVLDYGALADAVREQKLRVALDVYPDEPGAGDTTFRGAIMQTEGVIYGTHHIGASTEQAQHAIAQETVNIIKEYALSGRVRHCVNLQKIPQAEYVLVVRHLNRPGVLAHTLNAISHAGLNIEEMENVICDGAESACAQIKLSGRLNEETLKAIKDGNEHILAITHGPARD